MENVDILKMEEDLQFSIFDLPKEDVKSRGQLIERKIEALENLVVKVSNRRSRRWLNDRLLLELVPRLNVGEIRGLFAPPPWGESAGLSAFCMTTAGEWDSFRNVDMDKEATFIRAHENTSSKKGHLANDKLEALSAWRRINYQTRQALRHTFLLELVENYEEQIRAYVKGCSEEEVLQLYIENPFYRSLLHGVCEYYNLISATVTTSEHSKLKTTIIKKKAGSKQCLSLPAISLSQFLKTAKGGLL